MIRDQRGAEAELLHIDTQKLGRGDGVGHRISGDRRGPRCHSGWEIFDIDDPAPSPVNACR